MKNKRILKSRGFTLIELMVVIAIIGMLSSVVLASLSSARVKARNVARNYEIEQLRSAFALGVDSNGNLPSSGGSYACVSSSCYEGWSIYTANSGVDAVIAPFIKKPVDPAGVGRGYGGFLYLDPSAWSGTASFPPGYYLNWLLEAVPVTANICGPGEYYDATANYIQCLLRLK